MLIERAPTTFSLSHSAGPRDVPLLELTIGEALRRTVERYGEREALVVREQGYRATYRELLGRGGARRPRSARPRRAHRRSRRALGAQPVRVDRHPVRHRAHRRDPRDHQPGLQGGRAAVRADEDRREPARPGARLSPGRLRGDGRRGARRLPAAARDHRPRGRLGGPAGRRRGRGPRPTWRRSRRRSIPTTRSTSSSPRARPAPPRAPRSRTATSSTTATSRGASCATPSDDRVCVPVPFYHCFGMVLANLACLTHGACLVVPGASFDPLATLRTSRRSAAPRSTGCRRCSSPSSSTRASATSTSRACARGSWPARPARSRS